VATIAGSGNFGSLTNLGTMTLTNAQVSASSVLNDYGGLLTGNGFIQLSQNGTFTNNGTLSPTGLLSVTGGATTNNGDVYLGAGQKLGSNTTLYNYGGVNLSGGAVQYASIQNESGGVISGRGAVSGAILNLGGLIHATGGTLNLTGVSVANLGGVFQVDPFSTLNISTLFTNTGLISLGGTGAVLSGFEFGNSGTITGGGLIANTVLNSGTILSEGQLVFSGKGNTNAAAGHMEADAGSNILYTQGLSSNLGAIDLLGGRFDNNGHALTNTGSIEGYGTLATGGLTNNGSIDLANGSTNVLGSISNNGTIHVTDSPVTFFDVVDNNAAGTIENTGSSMQFLGGLVNNGAYISDPAVNIFSQLTVGDTGYLVGGLGDRFQVSGNFVNTSEENTLWDTGSWTESGAELDFLTGGSHTFSFDGIDEGASYLGYEDNFAWGELRLGVGQTLTFEGDASMAQYIGALVLDGGLSELSNIQSNGLNLYYDPELAQNAYLDDKTYSLSGGGYLEPAQAPEPATWVLIGLGLAALARKRLASGSGSPDRGWRVV
jgi:hypothetical protein